MKLSYFKRLTSQQPLDITLTKIVGKTKNPNNVQMNTIAARKWYAKGNKDKGDNIKKMYLPAFAPAAILVDGKKKEHVIDLTGLCFIDIDHITESDAEQTVKTLSEDPHTLFASISLSGKGVHLLVRYKIDFSNYDYPFISSPDKLRKVYKDVFLNLAKHYTETLGFQVDMSGVNAERLCLIAHDPNVYYNAESTAYIYDITNKTITHTV